MDINLEKWPHLFGQNFSPISHIMRDRRTGYAFHPIKSVGENLTDDSYGSLPIAFQALKILLSLPFPPALSTDREGWDPLSVEVGQEKISMLVTKICQNAPLGRAGLCIAPRPRSSATPCGIWCFDHSAGNIGVSNPVIRTAGVLDHWNKAGQRGISRILSAEAENDISL